jgi:hypothetical protein
MFWIVDWDFEGIAIGSDSERHVQKRARRVAEV